MTTYRKPNFQAEGLIDEPARVRTPRPSRPDLAFDYADLAAFLAASQDHPMTTDTRFEAATDFAPGGPDYLPDNEDHDDPEAWRDFWFPLAHEEPTCPACNDTGRAIARLSQHPTEQDEDEPCSCPAGIARAAAHDSPAPAWSPDSTEEVQF